MARKVITWHIPVAYIGTVAIVSLLTGQDIVVQVFGGGLMLGAFFMATDYSTSPVTNKGKLIFGLGCGLITVFIRYFGSYPEGVSYAILIMNCCVFLIEKISQPVKFGFVKPVKAEKEAAK